MWERSEMLINKDAIKTQSPHNTVVSQPWPLVGYGSEWPLNSEPGLQKTLVFVRGGVRRFPCDWCVLGCRKSTKINRVTCSWTYPCDGHLSNCLPSFVNSPPSSLRSFFEKLVSLFLKVWKHTHCTDMFAMATNIPLCSYLCHPQHGPQVTWGLHDKSALPGG